MEPMKDSRSRSRSRQSAAYIAMLPFWLALALWRRAPHHEGRVAGSKSGDGFFTRADCETHTCTHRLNGE